MNIDVQKKGNKVILRFESREDATEFFNGILCENATQYWFVRDVAQRYFVPAITVRKWCNKGLLKNYGEGKLMTFKKTEVVAFMKKMRRTKRPKVNYCFG